MNKLKFGVIIVAGGSGTRMGADYPKQFLKLRGKEILLHALDAVELSGVADEIVIVCHKDYLDFCRTLIGGRRLDECTEVVAGGETRQESVFNGLKALKDCDYVLIHDAVRCCVAPGDIKKISKHVSEDGSCALGVKVKDTLKIADAEGYICSTPDRDYLWQIQTPQAFSYDIILRAHQKAIENNLSATDDCALAEAFGEKIRIIEGSYENIKITTPSDMDIAELFLKKRYGL